MTTTRRPFLIGIAGGSASGKSTFAAALKTALEQEPNPLQVEVMGTDRYFFRGAESGPKLLLSTGVMMAHNNHPDSADFGRLVRDLEARCAEADAPDVIIVEGLMVLCVASLREHFDLKLFMELDADERALRRLLRDMGGARGNTDPAFIATYYRECARVGHARYVEPSRVHADLILRGDADFTRTAPFIAAIINGNR